MNASSPYSKDFATIWGRYIDWGKRRAGENGFLTRQLDQMGARTILDACLGDGCDSIYLLQHGYRVTSNEIDLHFITKAQENARQHHVSLTITSQDWRKMHGFTDASFDAIICLGNSFTYMQTPEAQRKALQNFHRILRPEGLLLIDQRNYDYILQNREEILKGNFRYSKKFVYCGETVTSYPIAISKNSVTIECNDSITGKKPNFAVYPFKGEELKEHLTKAGFVHVEKFCDYESKENYACDFIQWVARK